jgi:hypothetical protein
MTTITIPAWNALGLLPPIDAESPVSSHRSPYTVSLKDVVMRFSSSPERRAVLQGFLGYRHALHQMGLQSGFQWLDGSFMEDVETLEKRPPNDMDVVTFVNIPEAFNPSADDWLVLEQETAKKQFKVDAYIVEINLLPPEQVVKHAAYWYSLWSHRRNQAWKGFLQVNLNPGEDADALEWLGQYDVKGAQL